MNSHPGLFIVKGSRADTRQEYALLTADSDDDELISPQVPKNSGMWERVVDCDQERWCALMVDSGVSLRERDR